MLKSRFSFGLAAALALAGAAGVATTADAVTPKMTPAISPRRYDTRRSLFGGSLGGGSRGRRARRGWSNAQVKRMAVKRRNKVRARRASR